jgi:hypothetical protein
LPQGVKEFRVGPCFRIENRTVFQISFPAGFRSGHPFRTKPKGLAIEKYETRSFRAGELQGQLIPTRDEARGTRISGASLREILMPVIELDGAPVLWREKRALQAVVEQDLRVAGIAAWFGQQRHMRVDERTEQALGGNEPIALVRRSIHGDAPGLAAGVFAGWTDASEVAGVRGALELDEGLPVRLDACPECKA